MKVCAELTTSTSPVVAAADRLAQPTEAERKLLGRLFLSSKSLGNDHHVPGHLILQETALQKKAATTKGRPISVTIAVLPKFLPSIPKGIRRSRMSKGGRMKSLLLKHIMTVTEVRCIIRRGFSHLGLANWKYLECSRNNFLMLA